MQIFNLYTVEPDGIDDTSLESVDLGEVDRKGDAGGPWHSAWEMGP